MTEQTGWATFGGSVKVDESTFEDQVGGSKFLGVGEHKDVVIASVEPKTSQAGNFYVRVKYEDEEKAGINDNVILTGTDKEGNQQFHWIYRRFGAALCADPELRLKFFGEYLPKHPEAFKALVGLRVTIKVRLGSEGYIIKDVSTGGKMLVDVETDEQWEDTEIYEGYTEAVEAAKELQIKRCYCEIDRVSKPSEEAQEVNHAVLTKILEEEPTKEEKPKKSKKKPVSI